MSQSHGVEGGTTEEALKSSVTYGKEEILLVRTFFPMHKNLSNTMKERGKKSTTGLL